MNFKCVHCGADLGNSYSADDIGYCTYCSDCDCSMDCSPSGKYRVEIVDYSSGENKMLIKQGFVVDSISEVLDKVRALRDERKDNRYRVISEETGRCIDGLIAFVNISQLRKQLERECE